MVVYSFSLMRGKTAKCCQCLLPASGWRRLSLPFGLIWHQCHARPFPLFPPFRKLRWEVSGGGREGFANFWLICCFVISVVLPQVKKKTCKNLCRVGGISFQEKRKERGGGTRQVASLTLLPLPPLSWKRRSCEGTDFSREKEKENSIFPPEYNTISSPAYFVCGTIPLRVIVFSFFPQTLSLAIRFWSLAKSLPPPSPLPPPPPLSIRKGPSPSATAKYWSESEAHCWRSPTDQNRLDLSSSRNISFSSEIK